jgi:hypothetical protein
MTTIVCPMMYCGVPKKRAMRSAIRAGGEPRLEGHIRQRHRTRKALFGEQPLSCDTNPRPPGLIGAALDDDLAPVGKPNTSDLGQIANDEQDLRWLHPQGSSTPRVNPSRKVMHHHGRAEAYGGNLCDHALAWAGVPE